MHINQTAPESTSSICKGNNAQHRFPQYATASQLEPFRKLHFTGPTLPDAFMRFCQRVVATVATNEQENAEELNVLEYDDCFCVPQKTTSAFFWRHDIKLITPEKLSCTLQTLGSSRFPGFTFSIFDMPTGNEKVNYAAC